jgi:glycosyltransferase involved in cell wall biosynthesis
MPNKSITVLVPTYNHEKYIFDAIKSVKQQSLFNNSVIIVSDDCSIDRTFEIAKQAARGSHIVVQRTSNNLGVMRHYQRLVKDVETPFTAVLEGDDIWLTNRRLELMREMLMQNMQIGMCFSACIVDDEATTQRIKHPNWNNGRNRIIGIIDLITGSNPIASFSNCVYRTTDLKKALGNAEGCIGYDWFCNMKIALTSDIGFFAELSTLYRVHPAGQWSRLNINEKDMMILKSLEGIQQCASDDIQVFIKDAMRRFS